MPYLAMSKNPLKTPDPDPDVDDFLNVITSSLPKDTSPANFIKKIQSVVFTRGCQQTEKQTPGKR